MIRLVGTLTYRQLLILGAFATSDPRKVQRVARARDPDSLDDLGERRLLAIKVAGGLRAPGRLSQNMKLSDLESFPAKISDEKADVRLTRLGLQLTKLTRPNETMPADELARWRVGTPPPWDGHK